VGLRFSQGTDGSVLAADLQVLLANGAACGGPIGQAERGRLVASCTTADGTTIPGCVQLVSRADGSVAGQLNSSRRDD
jgi:hypothetical protein